MSDRPPRLISWLLRRCLPNDMVGASILGDLREEFERTASGRRWRYICAGLALSVRYAAVRIVSHVVSRFGRPAAHRAPGRTVFRTTSDDFRDAWRGLRRRPLFAAAGVGLLACGLSASSIVFSFVDAVMWP